MPAKKTSKAAAKPKAKAKARVKDLKAKKNPKGGDSLLQGSKVNPAGGTVASYNFQPAWPRK